MLVYLPFIMEGEVLDYVSLFFIFGLTSAYFTSLERRYLELVTFACCYWIREILDIYISSYFVCELFSSKSIRI